MRDILIEGGDIALSSKGRVEFVSGPKKVIEDLKRFLMNDLGYNRFHPWIGSNLENIIGQSYHPEGLANIRYAVRDALNRYTQAQIEELKRRIQERGNPLLAVGEAGPDSIIKNWTRLEIQELSGNILVRIGFETFTGAEEEVELFVSDYSPALQTLRE